ncbi:MAG: cell division protein ZapE [Pseudomonadota bacterium]
MTLYQTYKELIAEKDFEADEEQEKAVLLLQDIHQELKASKPFLPFLKPAPVKGAYFYGGVGRGKSMIMDLFFDSVSSSIKKRRVHFHEFMIETHDWLHQNRGNDLDDLLMDYVDHVTRSTRLLCFDEFYVRDVADAMILKRLFTAFIEKRMVIIATSNCAPDHLYEGGLQRDLFLPFIDFIKDEMHVVKLDNQKDYRSIAQADQDIYYFHPRDDDTKQKVDQLFLELSDEQPASMKTLSVKGRKIKVLAVGDIARFTFADLCEQPLAAEDYIQIAKNYDTIFVENVPVMTAEMRNEAKRFILLIDCIYEQKKRLVISAEADIHQLYGGKDHGFEFDRTVSRLMEMQSAAYHQERLDA